MRLSKYHNKKVIIDGIKFDSEKEGSYYVIDSRGLPAYYIFTNNDFSKEYWLRCVKAWKVEEND